MTGCAGCFGLGQDVYDPSLDVSEGGSYVPPPPAQQFYSPSGGGGGGTNWGNLIASLAQQWSKIGGQVVAPQVTMVRNPDGSFSYQAPASAAGAVIPGSLLGSGINTTTILLLGGGVVLVLVLVSALKKS
jgi:hypothetical protein